MEKIKAKTEGDRDYGGEVFGGKTRMFRRGVAGHSNLGKINGKGHICCFV
jgi:hypothetical protein